MIAVSLARPEGFAEIFDRHVGRVHGFVGFRVRRSEIDDVVAEVFRIAFEDRAKFDPAASSAAPWLLGIAANLVRRTHRNAERKYRAIERANTSSAPHIDPLLAVDSRLDAAGAVGQIEPSLEQLPMAEREVLLMTVWDEMTPTEIAIVLGIAPATVRTHLFRARKRLRTALAEAERPTESATEGAPE